MNAISRWYKKYIEDLKQMKEEEKPLNDGRRRWFNQEIERAKQELQVAESENEGEQ